MEAIFLFTALLFFYLFAVCVYFMPKNKTERALLYAVSVLSLLGFALFLNQYIHELIK